MSRVEENEKLVKNTNCFIKSCMEREYPDMKMAYMAIIAQVLMDVSKSLAIVADNCVGPLKKLADETEGVIKTLEHRCSTCKHRNDVDKSCNECDGCIHNQYYEENWEAEE